MKKLAALAALAVLCAGANGASSDEATTHPAVSALLQRLDPVRTAEVAYHEDIVTTRADAFRPTRSSVDFHAKVDRATSSGWVLTLTRTAMGETGVLVEIRDGAARQYSLAASGGAWQAGPDVMIMQDLDPVALALGFLYREVLPAAAEGAARSSVRIDGKDTELETVILSDADSRAVAFTDEAGLLQFEGRSPRYVVRESVDEFRRDPALGLVPARRTLYSKMRGLSESDSRLTLKELHVNDPSFTLSGDDNTSAGILRRYGKLR